MKTKLTNIAIGLVLDGMANGFADPDSYPVDGATSK
jgi:hypothetical protein